MRRRVPGRRPWLILVLGLVVLAPSINISVGQEAARADAEGERERLVMERFLALLEKAPRRGTALDRVYGYHVERGTLDDLIKRYQDRTAGDPKDGPSWLLLGLFEAQRGQDPAAVAALRRAEAERQLAAQMHQLGMHELAEAVLARARRRTGGSSSTLTSLMRQWQAQGKPDVAVQIALQVVRRGPSNPAQAGTITMVGGEDLAHREAVQVLARSGKLTELIERTEAQIARAPQSLQLYQLLATYHRAAGNKDKVKEVIARMARLRPDDARLTYQLAQQLSQAGDFAAGALFVAEAGGRVTTARGGPLPLSGTSLLASNGLLHEPVLEIVRAHHPGGAEEGE